MSTRHCLPFLCILLYPATCLPSPISFHQQICFQFPLLLLGDGLTFLYLCQVVANKMELRPKDKSQEMGSLARISQLTPFLAIPSRLNPPPPVQARSCSPSVWPTYLLSLSGVVCRLSFVERPLLVSIIVNPLTKMVPNIKAPEGIRWTLSPKYPGHLGCRDKSLVCLSRALWEQAHGRQPAHPHL